MNDIKLLINDTTKNAIDFLRNYELDYSEEIDIKLEVPVTLKELDSALESSLLLLKDQKCGLLFSGGIDSAVLAQKMNKMNIQYTAILVANQKELDYKNAIEAARLLNIDLNIIPLRIEDLEISIPKIMKLINSTDEKQINISVPFYLASEFMVKKDLEIAIVGQGADELFCGYQRYVDYMHEQPHNFQQYHLLDLKKSMKKNFKRDSAIFSSNGIALYLPFLNQQILELSLSLPNELLINLKRKPPIKKYFLRLYAEMLGLPEKICQKKKVAIQFGSGSYKLLRKLSLKYGFTKPFSQKHGYLRHVQLYLDYIAQQHHIKDSNLKFD